MLDLQDLHVHYAKNHILCGLNFRVQEGTVGALIGPNSAGKTTTLRTVAGLKAPTRGRILMAGRDVTALSTPERVGAGLVLVPEGRKLFVEYTVLDNLRMGAYHRADRNRLHDDFEQVYSIFPKLRERRGQRAGSMSGGEQQMVAIGRGLMARPRCLLLDEPTLGIAPIIIDEIEDAIRRLAASGLTIVIAEQNASMALRVAHRGHILQGGTISLAGSAKELAASTEVQKLYLGG